MILRRLSQALAERKFSTIAIELLVLVVGIFLGLQVDDWNDSRQDRADEALFIQRLHADVQLADAVTERIRERLLGRLNEITAAGQLLFGDTAATEMPDLLCRGLSASSLVTINAPRLASFDELVGTGRLNILQDKELLGALISLEQYRSALAALVSNTSANGSLVFLPAAFPDLITASNYLERGTGEVRVDAQCDLVAMRSDQAFLNQFSLNADIFDVFVRDGLAPWNAQFARVHEILDEVLGVEH